MSSNRICTIDNQMSAIFTHSILFVSLFASKLLTRTRIYYKKKMYLFTYVVRTLFLYANKQARRKHIRASGQIPQQ